MKHLKFKKRHNLQVDLAQLKEICSYLYQKYCPKQISDRRNVNKTCVSDPQILALLCLQRILDMESERKFFAWAKLFLPALKLDRTRFNRRARALLPVVGAMRRGLTAEYAQTGHIAIIDSLPNPLCQKVRNKRVKISSELDDIGYNAAKDFYFYGFKTHLSVTTNGYILDYVVTQASDHDSKVATTLIQDCPCPFVLADVGFV